MVSRLGFDALSALVLALTALLGAYIPAYLARRDRLAGGTGRSFTYVLGNMLSAGVMVSAGFCHLLGEALKQMPHMQFPMAPFLCGTGFLFTLVADKIAASASGGFHTGCGHGGSGGGNLPLKRSPTADSCCAVEVLAGVGIAERGASSGGGGGGGRSGSDRLEKHSSGSEPEVLGLLHERGPPSPMARARPRGANSGLPRQHSSGSGANGMMQEHAVVLSIDDNGSEGGPLSEHHQQQQQQYKAGGPGVSDLRASIDGTHPQQPLLLASSSPAHASAARHRAAGAQRDGSDSSLVFEMDAPEEGPLLAGASSGGAAGTAASRSVVSVSFLTAVLMGVALCFHSLLEGAAMGAQPTISNSLHIFIAIVSHKGLAAYALGSSIVDSDVSMRRFWSVVLPFTFASPLGIFVGYVISDIAKGVGAASISALASGTFLYVAFMEVIPKELREPSRMPLKLAALLAGFALMSVLAIWA